MMARTSLDVVVPAKALLELPLDVIFYLVSFLPTSSAACLTLSCKKMYHSLGTVYLEKVGVRYSDRLWTANARLEEQEVGNPSGGPEDWGPPSIRFTNNLRRKFLAIYGQDLPDVIFCHYCKFLHKPTETIPKIDFGRTVKACTMEEYNNYFGTGIFRHYTHFDFNFSAAQSVMERLRHGDNCSTELEAMSRTCFFYGNNFSRQTTTIAQIVDGRLWIRTTQFILRGKGFQAKFPDQIPLDLCPHITTLQKLPHKDVSEIKTCHTCCLDCVFDRQAIEGQGTVLRFTAWQDYGKLLRQTTSGVSDSRIISYHILMAYSGSRGYRKKHLRLLARLPSQTREHFLAYV